MARVAGEFEDSALLKIFAGKLDLAPIGYALGYSLIYGLGFVIIYLLHLTVATKPPANPPPTIPSYVGELHAHRSPPPARPER